MHRRRLQTRSPTGFALFRPGTIESAPVNAGSLHRLPFLFWIAQNMSEHLMSTYNRLPVQFERGEGVWLWDSEHRQYLDALAETHTGEETASAAAAG